MTTVFQFIILWEGLSLPEKNYLIDSHEWRSNKIVRQSDEDGDVVLTDVEQSLCEKGILYENQLYNHSQLEFHSDIAWIFTGLELKASFK
jgi:hypothetical protein